MSIESEVNKIMEEAGSHIFDTEVFLRSQCSRPLIAMITCLGTAAWIYHNQRFGEGDTPMSAETVCGLLQRFLITKVKE